MKFKIFIFSFLFIILCLFLSLNQECFATEDYIIDFSPCKAIFQSEPGYEPSNFNNLTYNYKDFLETNYSGIDLSLYKYCIVYVNYSTSNSFYIYVFFSTTPFYCAVQQNSDGYYQRIYGTSDFSQNGTYYAVGFVLEYYNLSIASTKSLITLNITSSSQNVKCVSLGDGFQNLSFRTGINFNDNLYTNTNFDTIYDKNYFVGYSTYGDYAVQYDLDLLSAFSSGGDTGGDSGGDTGGDNGGDTGGDSGGDSGDVNDNIFVAISEFFGNFWDNFIHIFVPNEDDFTELQDSFNENILSIFNITSLSRSSDYSNSDKYPSINYNGQYPIINIFGYDYETKQIYDLLHTPISFGTLRYYMGETMSSTSVNNGGLTPYNIINICIAIEFATLNIVLFNKFFNKGE